MMNEGDASALSINSAVVAGCEKGMPEVIGRSGFPGDLSLHRRSVSAESALAPRNSPISAVLFRESC